MKTLGRWIGRVLGAALDALLGHDGPALREPRWNRHRSAASEAQWSTRLPGRMQASMGRGWQQTASSTGGFRSSSRPDSDAV